MRGLGIGDWGLGIGDSAQSPIPNPQSPIPNPHFCFYLKINLENIFIKNKTMLIFVFSNIRIKIKNVN